LATYAFLCLVANHEGVSFYRRERIGRELGLDDTQVHQALRRLEELDLVAYLPFRRGAADGFRQVLSLPGGQAPIQVNDFVTDLANRLGRHPDMTR
jgi:DNA-binding MarR family transcriptional regulator